MARKGIGVSPPPARTIVACHERSFSCRISEKSLQPVRGHASIPPSAQIAKAARKTTTHRRAQRGALTSLESAAISIGVPSRLIKTEAGVGRQERTPCKHVRSLLVGREDQLRISLDELAREAARRRRDGARRTPGSPSTTGRTRPRGERASSRCASSGLRRRAGARRRLPDRELPRGTVGARRARRACREGVARALRAPPRGELAALVADLPGSEAALPSAGGGGRRQSALCVACRPRRVRPPGPAPRARADPRARLPALPRSRLRLPGRHRLLLLVLGFGVMLSAAPGAAAGAGVVWAARRLCRG